LSVFVELANFAIVSAINDVIFTPLFTDVLPDSSARIIAGPCSAESRDVTISAAGQLAAQGVRILRAGLWKPRTRPGSFEGRGAVGLPWLREAKDKFGLKIITEVANAYHVRAAVKGGIDGVWIGARTVANPFAVQEIVDAIKDMGVDICVLIKNPVSPDLDLWIGAIERFMRAGILRLGAVHRGFSRYGENIYRNAPIWSIPIELKRRFPALPIYHDPSHCSGKASMIGHLSQQAIDLGFYGLMIESHPDPECALSDASQQITPQELGRIVGNLDFRECSGNNSGLLTQFRNEIDELDSQLLEILARRLDICTRIGEYKRENAMKVVQEKRYSRLLSERVHEGVEMGLEDSFLREIFAAIHSESVRRQLNVIERDRQA